MDLPALKGIISLLEEVIGRKKDATCVQLLLAMYAAEADGITQKELAAKLGINESTVSRTVRILGPEGTKCLYKEGDIIYPAERVAKMIERIERDF